MPNITPFLWFDNQAEAAADFYVGIFPNSRIGAVSRTPEGGRGEPGGVMVVEFFLDGQRFTALNGGPAFNFTEAVSFVVPAKDQAEVDHYWEKLTADGGEAGRCGWLKDRFGVSWQVVPDGLSALLGDPDRGRAQRAIEAMFTMSKLDLDAMRQAADAA